MSVLPKEISEVFYRLNLRLSLPSELLSSAFRSVLDTKDHAHRDIWLSALLTGVMSRGPHEDEVVAMLREAFKTDSFVPFSGPSALPKNKRPVIGVVGSGKKGLKTINISTPASLLAASLGVPIAKAGSHATSSLTGAADFMSLVGADTRLNTNDCISILEKLNFGFFSIESVVPRFDRAYGGRFYAPHCLSFGLAALLLPCKVDILLYGLSHPNVELALRVIRHFGSRDALVLTSTPDSIHYVDEMLIFGKTTLVGMRDAGIGKMINFDPVVELKLKNFSHQAVKQLSTTSENIKAALSALKGKGKDGHASVIALNAANMLFLSGSVSDAKEGYDVCLRQLKTGDAYELLRAYIRSSGGDIRKLESLES